MPPQQRDLSKQSDASPTPSQVPPLTPSGAPFGRASLSSGPTVSPSSAADGVPSIVTPETTKPSPQPFSFRCPSPSASPPASDPFFTANNSQKNSLGPSMSINLRSRSQSPRSTRPSAFEMPSPSPIPSLSFTARGMGRPSSSTSRHSFGNDTTRSFSSLPPEGASPLPYDVKEETSSPSHPFYTQSSRSKGIEDGIRLAKDINVALQRLSVDMASDADVSRFVEEAKRLSNFEAHDLKRIAVLGDSGAGNFDLTWHLLISIH